MFSMAFGVGTKDSKGQWLEVFYPQPLLQPAAKLVEAVVTIMNYKGGNQALELDALHLRRLGESCEGLDARQDELLRQLAGSKRPIVVTLLETDSKPESVPEVYLKLHLLSHRLVKPHGLNLDGMFGVLPNVAWTSRGAIAIADLPAEQLAARLQGETLAVNSVDKFPKMTDYVVPAGVRIADTARVRLGAYIGEGTTIMHEGFCNFNAGTEGPAMIEGRISAGVWVNANSDLGGGCSVLGTLSGGHFHRPELPDRRQRRPRHSAGRPLHHRSRPLCHGRHQGHAARQPGQGRRHLQGTRAVGQERHAVPPQLRDGPRRVPDQQDRNRTERCTAQPQLSLTA